MAKRENGRLRMGCGEPLCGPLLRQSPPAPAPALAPQPAVTEGQRNPPPPEPGR